MGEVQGLKGRFGQSGQSASEIEGQGKKYLTGRAAEQSKLLTSLTEYQREDEINRNAIETSPAPGAKPLRSGAHNVTIGVKGLEDYMLAAQESAQGGPRDRSFFDYVDHHGKKGNLAEDAGHGIIHYMQKRTGENVTDVTLRPATLGKISILQLSGPVSNLHAQDLKFGNFGVDDSIRNSNFDNCSADFTAFYPSSNVVNVSMQNFRTEYLYLLGRIDGLDIRGLRHQTQDAPTEVLIQGAGAGIRHGNLNKAKANLYSDENGMRLEDTSIVNASLNVPDRSPPTYIAMSNCVMLGGELNMNANRLNMEQSIMIGVQIKSTDPNFADRLQHGRFNITTIQQLTEHLNNNPSFEQRLAAENILKNEDLRNMLKSRNVEMSDATLTDLAQASAKSDRENPGYKDYLAKAQVEAVGVEISAGEASPNPVTAGMRR